MEGQGLRHTGLSARRRRLLAWVTLGYPLLLLAALYGEYLLAWRALGHAPRPSMDDPKYITGASWMHGVVGIGLVALVPVAWAGLTVNALDVFDRRSCRWRWAAARASAFALVWYGTWAWCRWDPGRVMEWWAD